MELSVMEKTSKLKISVCGRKLNSVPYACVYQYFKIQWKPLFTLFWGLMKNYVNCRKEYNAGNAKIISLTLNWNAQQIMWVNCYAK
jgi:hypothetical protein